MSHAYTIIAAFEMTDANNTVHKMLLVRNPWSSTGYSYDWHKGDTRWTAALAAQVPYGFDPMNTNNAESGLFVAPIEALLNGHCFDMYDIGHLRDDEGFVETWYDEIGDDESTNYYYFTPDTFDSDIYFTAESYSYNIVPLTCTTGTISTG